MKDVYRSTCGTSDQGNFQHTSVQPSSRRLKWRRRSYNNSHRGRGTSDTSWAILGVWLFVSLLAGMASLLGRNALNITRMCSYRIAVPGVMGRRGRRFSDSHVGEDISAVRGEGGVGGGHNISLLYIPPECVLQTPERVSS